jgi:LssY-like putative type I secretion system component LssY
MSGNAEASIRRVLFPVMVLIPLAGCGPSAPDASGAGAFINRALAQERQGIVVRTSVLTDEESRRYFGESTADADVQPVWIQVRNDSDDPLLFLPILTDPAYYAPQEVAQRLHGWLSRRTNDLVDAAFQSNRMPYYVEAHHTASGFVYTHEDGGLKLVNVGLATARRIVPFRFVVPIAGVQYAVQRVDFSGLYPPDTIQDMTLEQLRTRLESLPCCVTNKDQSASGDPLNLVIVGNGVDALFAFSARGWRLNEPVDAGSSWRMTKAFLLRSEYDTAPVSPLYVFSRYQDVALQKARSTVSQRNHLRLWLAPFTLEGQNVWIGQISRDVGVKLTTKSWSLTTHRISAHVDQERDYLLQDLLLTGLVERFGYVKGVGESTAVNPRENLTDDPYYTDGLRLVVVLSAEPHPLLQVQRLDWERPVAAR